jgi:HEAT repeat protein
MKDANDHLARLVEDPAAFLADPDPTVRRLAVSGCSSLLDDTALVGRLLELATDDPEPRVRAEAVEVVSAAGPIAFDTALEAAGDGSATVVEAAATALGELEDPRAVEVLILLAEDHDDRMVREAAVAALGAIGEDRALPALLDLVTSAPPQIRRRCVAALTVFDDPRALDAVRAARNDRNPMVKEAALMAVGYETPDETTDRPRMTGDGDA